MVFWKSLVAVLLSGAVVAGSARAACNGSLSVPMCHPHVMFTSSPSTMFAGQFVVWF